MSEHLPRRAQLDQSSLAVDWPLAFRQVEEVHSELVWVSDRCEHPPDWYPDTLEPVEESPRKGLPEEGEVIGDEGLFRPFLGCRSSQGWWVLDGVTGKLVAGEVRADSKQSRYRLFYLTAVSLFTIFLGGSLLLSLLMSLASALQFRAQIHAVTGGSASYSPVLVGLIGLATLLWMVFRMAGAYFGALREPAARADTLQIDLPLNEDWKGLFQAPGILMVLIALLTFLNGFQAKTLLGMFLGVVQMVGSGWLGYHLLRESGGKGLSFHRNFELPGTVGSTVGLCLRVGLMAFLGVGVFRLAQPTLDIQIDPNTLALLGGQLGALFGVWSARHEKDGGLLVGLAVNLVGYWLLGAWAGPLLAVVAVVIVAKDKIRSVEFGLALAGGRLFGRLLGFYFFGTLGVVVGEVLVESVLACAVWRRAG